MIDKLTAWLKSNPDAPFDAARDLISRDHGAMDDEKKEGNVAA